MREVTECEKSNDKGELLIGLVLGGLAERVHVEAAVVVIPKTLLHQNFKAVVLGPGGRGEIEEVFKATRS